MARRPMDDVELVEEHVDEPSDVAEQWAERTRGRIRATAARVLAHWPAALAVIVLVVGAGVGIHVVDQRRESARIAALVGLPGIVSPPLDGPPEQLWDVADPPDDGGLWAVGDRLVGVRSGTRGAVDVQALDRATGELVWSTELRAGDPPSGSPELDEWGYAQCVLTEAGTGTAGTVPPLACVVVDEWSATPDVDGNIQPISSEIVVVDPADGSIRARHAVAAGAAVAAVGGDLVLAAVDRDETLHVSRVEPVSGTTLWAYEDAVPEEPSAGYRGTSAWVQTAGDDVTVTSRGHSWVLRPDGDVLQAAIVADGVVPIGDRLAAVAFGWGSDFSVTTTLLGDDGALGRPLDVQLIQPTADDGSLPDLMLANLPDTTLVGVDLTTGDQLWEADVRGVDSVMVVDGAVVVGTGVGVTRLDPRTGEARWTTEVLRSDSTLMTDGRSVLAVHSDGRSGRVLGRLDLASGAEVWTTPVPSAASWLRPVDGMLIGQGSDRLVALGSRD